MIKNIIRNLYNKIIPVAKTYWYTGHLAPIIEGGIEAPLQFNFLCNTKSPIYVKGILCFWLKSEKPRSRIRKRNQEKCAKLIILQFQANDHGLLSYIVHYIWKSTTYHLIPQFLWLVVTSKNKYLSFTIKNKWIILHFSVKNI